MHTNIIHCGNHLDVLKQYPDGCFDMCLTSPPYDNLRTYKGYDFQFEPLAHELFRVLKAGGVCVWVVNDATVNGSETLTSFKQAIYFKEEVGFNVHDTMIYEAKGTGAKGSNLAYWQCFEFMIVLTKGRPKTVNRIADVKNTTQGLLRGGRNYKKEKPHKTSQVGVRTNIWEYSVGFMDASDKTEHPAPFPEKLAEDHILSWSNPGDVILDPMGGSGTVGKMAAKHQREYVLIDVAQEYCDIARKRIDRFTAQTTIFD